MDDYSTKEKKRWKFTMHEHLTGVTKRTEPADLQVNLLIFFFSLSGYTSRFVHETLGKQSSSTCRGQQRKNVLCGGLFFQQITQCNARTFRKSSVSSCSIKK